jgi:predicted alpha/beta hydrolase family esterase
VSSKAIRIILIHGTWAKNAEWIQDDSKLSRVLKDEFSKVSIEKFEWDGKNNVRKRAIASKNLLKKIKSNSTEDCILISHSHGGNIAVNSLTNNLKNLKGIVTLNTPFLYALKK